MQTHTNKQTRTILHKLLFQPTLASNLARVGPPSHRAMRLAAIVPQTRIALRRVCCDVGLCANNFSKRLLQKNPLRCECVFINHRVSVCVCVIASGKMVLVLDLGPTHCILMRFLFMCGRVYAFLKQHIFAHMLSHSSPPLVLPSRAEQSIFTTSCKSARVFLMACACAGHAHVRLYTLFGRALAIRYPGTTKRLEFAKWKRNSVAPGIKQLA